MRFTTRGSVRLGIAVSVVAGLTASGMAGADASPRKTAAPYERPYIDVKITDSNLVAHTGGGAFATGQMDLSLEAAGDERAVAVVRFADGYTFKDFRDDLRTFGESFGQNGPSKSGLKALNHAINHTTGYGGIEAPQGHTRRATLLLDTEGTYTVYDDTHNLPRHAERFDISGSVGPQHLPPSGGVVKMKTNRRFGGDDVLPAKGNIKIKNISTQSPHFLVLQHVKEGTTKKQVLKAFQSESNEPPSWVRKGEAGSDVLSYGKAQNLHVNLPDGQYVEMCFFPDPEEGTPHAFMGMLRMVHLK